MCGSETNFIVRDRVLVNQEDSSLEMIVVETRTIRWMYDYMRLDRIKNELSRDKVGVAPIENKMRETMIRRFGPC